MSIFVFGSNTAGLHGRGAALTAYKRHGAIYGKGYGHYGDSFGIPTVGHAGIWDDGIFVKNILGSPLSLEEIKVFTDTFILYAKYHQEMSFKVTRIGCGLAGHPDKDIAPLFFDAPTNCTFDLAWKPHFSQIKKPFRYWGTFA